MTPYIQTVKEVNIRSLHLLRHTNEQLFALQVTQHVHMQFIDEHRHNRRPHAT